MATKIVQEVARVVYESPEGRVKVVREGNKDYALYCDTFFVKSYDYAFQAEHAGGVWLHEQAAQLAADLADEQAEKDADDEEGIERFELGECSISIDVNEAEFVSLCLTTTVNQSSKTELRTLARLLENPRLRSLIGLAPPTNSDFGRALSGICDLLPLMGETRNEQAGVLDLMAGIVKGSITVDRSTA